MPQRATFPPSVSWTYLFLRAGDGSKATCPTAVAPAPRPYYRPLRDALVAGAHGHLVLVCGVGAATFEELDLGQLGAESGRTVLQITE